MQKLIIIAGFFLTNYVYGQQLIFRGLPVDSISISGSAGYYHFDDKGTTTGREDIYIIGYEKATNKYLVDDYIKVSILNTCKPDTLTRKIKHLKQGKGKIISNMTLGELLNAFNSKYNKSTFENIGYDNHAFFSLTDENHIRKVAKAYKQDWHFKMSYSSKEKNKVIFEGCQNIDTFNLFLATAFDTCGYVMLTDVWDEMKVRIKTATKSFSFEGKYPNPFKQPWYDHSDTSKIIAAAILNLNLNKTLSLILPDKFYRKNTIEFTALTNQYIKWYLQRRDIIYRND